MYVLVCCVWFFDVWKLLYSTDFTCYERMNNLPVIHKIKFMVHLNITNLRKYYMVFVCFDRVFNFINSLLLFAVGFFFHEVLTFKQTTYTPIACVKSLRGIFTVLRFRIFHRKLLKNKNEPNTSFLHSA